MLRKTLIVLAAALALGTTAVSTSAFARGGGHGGGGGGVVHFRSSGSHFGGGHFDRDHFRHHDHFRHGFNGFGVWEAPYCVWPYTYGNYDECY